MYSYIYWQFLWKWIRAPACVFEGILPIVNRSLKSPFIAYRQQLLLAVLLLTAEKWSFQPSYSEFCLNCNVWYFYTRKWSAQDFSHINVENPSSNSKFLFVQRNSAFFSLETTSRKKNQIAGGEQRMLHKIKKHFLKSFIKDCHL